MFGFGRSANEKAVINLFALQLEAVGLPSREAVDSATKLVDDVLTEIRPRGIDPFKSTQGNDYVAREQFVAPRLAAGLTTENIQSHWNRPLLVVLCEVKMREMVNFIMIHMAEQQGKDLVEAGDHYKKTFPRYGDPAQWNPNEKFNVGLRESDADIYPEFAGRVDAWQRRTGDTEVTRLIKEHGTLNAAIRQQVASGSL